MGSKPTVLLGGLVWFMGSRPTVLLGGLVWFMGSPYLQVRVVDRELGAEEPFDNCHDRFCDILLQGHVGMVTVSGAVAHL